MENANHPAQAAVQKNYVWLTLGFFLPVFAFYAVYTIFQSREAAKGSWLESHTDFQVRLVSVVAVVLAVGIVLGMLHISLLSVLAFGFLFLWYMLRIAKGWSQLGVGEAAESGWI
ncbi:MAG: hypothetical protein ACPGSC_04775 [Granulosicoccaceae bacterium]